MKKIYFSYFLFCFMTSNLSLWASHGDPSRLSEDHSWSPFNGQNPFTINIGTPLNLFDWPPTPQAQGLPPANQPTSESTDEQRSHAQPNAEGENQEMVYIPRPISQSIPPVRKAMKLNAIDGNTVWGTYYSFDKVTLFGLKTLPIRRETCFNRHNPIQFCEIFSKSSKLRMFYSTERIINAETLSFDGFPTLLRRKVVVFTSLVHFIFLHYSNSTHFPLIATASNDCERYGYATITNEALCIFEKMSRSVIFQNEGLFLLDRPLAEETDCENLLVIRRV